MIIPRTFTLGGHTYQVTLDPESRERGRMGECYHVLKQVRISPDLPQSQREETFLHEVVEAIDSLHELKLEHGVICTLAVGLHQALTSGHGALDDHLPDGAR